MLVLSRKDRDRLKVLHEAERGHLTQREAGEQLGLSGRWARQLLARLRQEGDRGIVHRLRGQASNRRLARAVQRRAVKLVKTRYGDFGPTLAAEYLKEKHGLRVSKETLRQLLIAEGVWRARPRRVEEVHGWRPRRSCWGELVQWDSSEHDWLEGRGEAVLLIAMIDDATSRLYGRFVRQDTTEENLGVLQGYLERWGRPAAFYTDQASLFRVNRRASREEELEGQEPVTQIGRVLRELGIEWIAAHSPQAKGRVERCFGTLQDRLVKGLRVAGARTVEEANAYLEREFLPGWEKRFTVKPAKSVNAHRPLGADHDLAAILSVVEHRVVANDYTLRWEGQLYQIARADIRGGLRGARVRVEKRGNGSVAVKFRERYLTVSECQPVARPESRAVKRPRRVPSPTVHRWMEGFSLQDSPPLWKVLHPEKATG